VKMENGKILLEVNGLDVPVDNVLSVSEEAIIITSTIVQIYPNTPELSAMK